MTGLTPPFNLILEGVPGTTKTYAVKQLEQKFGGSEAAKAAGLAGNGQGRYAMTMHPATAYEDFVEGMRPGDPAARTNDTTVRVIGRLPEPTETWFFDAPTPTGKSPFQVHDGFFVSVCAEAYRNPSKLYVVLLDEINRCNIPKVMGDLLTTIERSKRARWVKVKEEEESGTSTDAWDLTDAQVVTLPYSKRQFFVPDNIIVIGTMNTTDRSVAPMDAALRRRFAFVRTWPMGFVPIVEDAASLSSTISGHKNLNRTAASWLSPSVTLWHAINTHFRDFGDDAMLGHSYLYDLATELKDAVDGHQAEIVKAHWNLYIFPQVVDIIQSNDLNGKVFNMKTSKKGPLVDLEGKLFEGKLPPTIEGEWTNRGSGMLRVPTLTLTVATSKD